MPTVLGIADYGRQDAASPVRRAAQDSSPKRGGAESEVLAVTRADALMHSPVWVDT